MDLCCCLVNDFYYSKCSCGCACRIVGLNHRMLFKWMGSIVGVETDYGEATEGPSTSSLLKDWKGRVGQIAPGREREEKGLDQRTVDSVANILLRLSFMFGETGATDSFGRRCIRILKFFMRRDMCPNAEVRLQWMDKILASVDQTGSVKLNPSQDQPVQVNLGYRGGKPV